MVLVEPTAALAPSLVQQVLDLVANLPAQNVAQRLGYDVVATLPGAFRHSRLGYVDALVMYKSLVD